MVWFPQLAGDPVLVVVIRKGIQSPSHRFQPLHIVGDLKIVMVVVTGVKSLMELIIGNRVKHFSIDPSSVFSVDHLAHEPEILLHGGGAAAQLLHEGKI